MAQVDFKYCFQASLPDSLPPSVCFSAANTSPISAPITGTHRTEIRMVLTKDAVRDEGNGKKLDKVYKLLVIRLTRSGCLMFSTVMIITLES